MSNATAVRERPITRPHGFITTFTGGRVYLADPRPGDVRIEDIAHALSNLCHWVGHSRRFISIAEHSVLVSRQFRHDGDALWGLMHDAPEAYLGDVSRPLKAMLPDYRKLEARWMDAIRDACGLPLVEPVALKAQDNAVLAAEAMALVDLEASERERIFGLPATCRIECLRPEIAEVLFLTRFRALQP